MPRAGKHPPYIWLQEFMLSMQSVKKQEVVSGGGVVFDGESVVDGQPGSVNDGVVKPSYIS